MKNGCYSNRRLLIDLSAQSYDIEEISREELSLWVGGRGINIWQLYQRTNPKIDPFSEENPLLLAPGALVGTPCLFANRMTISSKSPLTGVVGDSNIGGLAPVFMKWCGFDQIVILGRSKDPVYIVVTPTRCLFKDASHIWGKTTVESAGIINSEVVQTPKSPPLVIGPAGENLIRFASINSEGHAAGRTGLGSVMGYKKLKGIIFAGKKNLTDFKGMDSKMQRLYQIIEADPAVEKAKRYGATTAIEGFNNLGVLEVKNLQYGTWEEVDKISGKTVRDSFCVDTHGCVYCSIACKARSSFQKTRYGDFKMNGPEFAALQNFGARILNPDPIAACYLTDLSNKLGLDFMSFGAIMSWLMECFDNHVVSASDLDGLRLEWGNVDVVEELMKKTAYRQGVGDSIAEGSYRFSNVLGEKSKKYLLAVKKMEFEGCDPRGMKGRGVGFGVASRGADNCRTLGSIETTITGEKALEMFGSEEAAILTGNKGKGKLLKFIEDLTNIADLLGLCKFGMYVFSSNIEEIYRRHNLIVEVFSSLNNFPLEEKTNRFLLDASERMLNLERLYNHREGLSREDDLLPARFRFEEMPSGPARGSVVENDSILDEYYFERGWDLKDGMPTKETLDRLGINLST